MCIKKNLFILTAVFIMINIHSIDNKKVTLDFAEYILSMYKDPDSLSSKGWEYTNSIVLMGLKEVYLKTKDKRYFDYIKKWVDTYVNKDGSIYFNQNDNNLDRIHPANLLLFLYEETKDEKYKIASKTVKDKLLINPRNKSGGFWHKDRYPHQMWLDGIYMAEPFLIKFGMLFGNKNECEDEAVFQTILIAEHTYDQQTGLFYHAWNETKDISWANPKTGVSGEFWLRGMGWFVMALADMLPFLSKEHPSYNKIKNILSQAAAGIKKYQDPKTGLWFQIIDKGNKPGNWLETSGSAMFIYAVKKAVLNGYIDKSYNTVAEKGWEGLKQKIKYHSDGFPRINDAVTGMGVQNSYFDYINQDKLTNSHHLLCAALLAGSIMEFK